MQFTKAGYTQLRGNSIMITSTITIVLFSTVVSISKLYFCIWIFNHLITEILLVHAGVWINDKTHNQMFASLTQALVKNEIFRTCNSKILHCTSSQWARLRSWSWWQPRSSSNQLEDASDYSGSHSPLLLEKIWQCLHATCLWWTRIRTIRTRFAYWRTWKSMAMKCAHNKSAVFLCGFSVGYNVECFSVSR